MKIDYFPLGLVLETPASSTAQSLAVLEEKDYIYRDREGYYVLTDPLIKKMLSRH